MFLTIVNGWLITLKSGFMYPFQPNLLIFRNSIASHVKPSNGKLSLRITTMSSQFVPKGTFF